MSSQVIFTNTLPTTSATFTCGPNNHHPDKFTEKKRNELKAAFRLAINKSKTRDEALRLTKLREKFFQPGGMSEDQAIIAWLEISLMCKSTGKPNVGSANGRFHVAAG